MKRHFEHFVWWITPMWLGELIRSRLGYVMGARFDAESGRFLKLYFVKAGYPDLKRFYENDSKLKEIIERIERLPW